MSKEAEFFTFVRGLSEFLAPRFEETLIKLATEFRNEIKQESKDSIMSKELQELEPLLMDLRKSYSIGEGMANLHLKAIVKKIIQLYKPLQ